MSEAPAGFSVHPVPGLPEFSPGDPADVPGVMVEQVPLLMSSPEATTALARAALDAAVAGARDTHV